MKKVVALFVFALLSFTVHFADAADCVPFAATHVPDEKSGEWSLRPVEQSYDTPYSSRRYYETASGLRMGVYTFFGKPGYKAWACRNSIADPTTKNIPDHRIAVWKDGQWHSAYAQHANVELFKDAAGIIVRIEITLRDQKTGTEVVKSVITP